MKIAVKSIAAVLLVGTLLYSEYIFDSKFEVIKSLLNAYLGVSLGNVVEIAFAVIVSLMVVLFIMDIKEG